MVPVVDPGTDALIVWDDTDDAPAYATIGTGLVYTHATHTLSVNASGITAGDTQVIYSDGANNPVGDADLTWNKTTNTLKLANIDGTGGGVLKLLTSGDGVDIQIYPGNGTSDPSTGGSVDILAGNGHSTGASAEGGVIFLTGGDAAADAQGGNIDIVPGASVGTRLGGRVLNNGGQGGATGAGGFVLNIGGRGGLTNGKGGPVWLQGGIAQGNANGGDIAIIAGDKAGSGTDGRIMLGANSLAITAGTGNTPITGVTAAILDVSSIAASNKTFTFPNSTGTFALTNNKLSVFAATSSSELAGVISDETGSGALVFANTPTLVTPALGAATATSINGLTITSSTGTFTLTNGKTFAVAKTLTLDGTDSTTMTFPSSSATIARTDAANTFSGHQTIEGVTSTGATGTGKFVFDGTPTLVTPLLGTPTSGTLTNCTGLPIAGLVASTSTAIGVGSIELGHASDTTIARVSAGVVSIEGVNIVDVSSSQTLTTKTLTAPIVGGAAVLGDAGSIKFTLPTVDTTATGITTNEFNSGYSSTAIGDLVYLDSSATWQKAKADSTTTSTNLLGIALSVTASGAAANVLLRGWIYATPFPTLTVGAPVYISGATSGAVVTTAPSTTDYVIRVVGHAFHADKMWFNPDGAWITHA